MRIAKVGAAKPPVVRTKSIEAPAASTNDIRSALGKCTSLYETPSVSAVVVSR